MPDTFQSALYIPARLFLSNKPMKSALIFFSVAEKGRWKHREVKSLDKHAQLKLGISSYQCASRVYTLFYLQQGALELLRI